MKSYRAGGGSLPVVILADPTLSKVYGTYNHAELKGQDYRSIFRDARRAMAEDKKNGTFGAKAVEANEEVKPVAKKVEKKKPVGKIVPSSRDAFIYTIDEPVEEVWYNSTGSRIRAKLIAVEDGKLFHLETSSGKVLKVKASQLDANSAARAKAATN